MRTASNRRAHQLAPMALVLFVLVCLTFPIACGTAYAGRSEQPDHILTYTSGKLSWDDTTGIDPNGAARLSAFDAVYQNAASEDGSKLVAPGTESTNIIRLKNDADRTVEYTAVLYTYRTSEALPVQVSMSAGGAADTDSYILPDNISKAHVLQTLNGSIDSKKMQDIDIDWFWTYDIDKAHDIADTDLGNQAAKEKAEELTVGVYIVVEDDGADSGTPGSGSIVRPSSPDTRDHSQVELYLGLLCVSAAAMLLLLLNRRKVQK